MLKDLLIICAELIDRDDLVSTLKSIDDTAQIENKQIQNDVLKLINYYNFTMNAICENYLNLVNTEKLYSDKDKKIKYYKFEHEPVRILDVKDELNGRVLYDVFPTHILTNSACKCFYVTYKFLPNTLYKLSDKLNLPNTNLKKNTIAYGIVSEFLASKSQFNQSNYWRDRFLDSLFKTKIQKERRLKSTFAL